MRFAKEWGRNAGIHRAAGAWNFEEQAPVGTSVEELIAQ